MNSWRIEFDMICEGNGKKCCVSGKWTRAFGLMDSPEKPNELLAREFINLNLYYCSKTAEAHFSDTGSHRIAIHDIVSAEFVR